ncbi:hypothetical protein ABT215_09320 [Streptomyces sp900105755]|uniref:hypothetical protein n=1 Tax=Streptomyces sp. 900105755 TaxID=3154389 RepID=UPI003321FE9F
MPCRQGWLRTYTAAARVLAGNRVRAQGRAGAALSARQTIACAPDGDGAACAGQRSSPAGRERQIVDLLAEGPADQRIAMRLQSAVHTPETSVRRVREQHGPHSRAHAAAWSVRQFARPVT